MRIPQNVIAALLVLLATGAPVALAAEPAVAIEITYSYVPDPSTATPLNGAQVHDWFYVFFDPGLPEDTTRAEFIDTWYRPWLPPLSFPVGSSSIAPFSIRFDPYHPPRPGGHRLVVNYWTESSPDPSHVEAEFSVTYQRAAVQFTVIADSHICNPYVTGKLGGTNCTWSSQVDRRRTYLENLVGARLRIDNDFVFSLGDAIEDLYLFHDFTTPHYYFKYVKETFPVVPHYTVLGNHDIRSSGSFIFRELAKDIFQDYSGEYDVGPFIRAAHGFSKNGWDFYLLHSGEEVPTKDEGSCVRFSQNQLDGLDAYLTNLPGKTAILFWHVSPEGEILRTAPEYCLPGPFHNTYIDLLEKHAKKIKAVITGHVHNSRSYIWNPADGSVWSSDTHDFNPVNENEIMMYTVTSTGQPKGWDHESDLYMEVSLHADGTLTIDNKYSIQWTAISGSNAPPAPTPDVFVEGNYTQADSCFEQDNDGDGWFNDDEIDCPGGTNMGAGLDYDSDQQIFTIETKLDKSGRVRNYTPGQYYAVSSVDIGETALEDLRISQHYENCTNGTPPISKLNPKRGGGAVAVVVAGPDGVARQIANAKTRDYTDQTSGISVVAVEHNDSYTEAHLENVPADSYVVLYVKFAPGLKGELFTEGSSCDVETSIWLDDIDSAFAETVALEVVDNK